MQTSKIYYYDHKTKSTPELGTVDETMWRGDQYVGSQSTTNQNKLKSGGANRELIQHRKMRQSRLFITYYLHRATTSEDEARFLMTRMADAAHELFGNDQNLSELLVFGYKVSSSMGNTDPLSVGGFTLIEKPNKKDQQPFFYGDTTESSYMCMHMHMYMYMSR